MSNQLKQLERIWFTTETKNGVTKFVNGWWPYTRMECPQFVKEGCWNCWIYDRANPYIVIREEKIYITQEQAEYLVKYRQMTWGAMMLCKKQRFLSSIARMPD